jgi:tRNA G10  N-methylase Trm11
LTGLRDVDCILTDPLYQKDAIHLYGELARHAAKALRPGGTLAVMCGNLFLPEVLALMTPHLEYRCLVATLTTQQPRLSIRKIYSHWKPVAVFTKGRPPGGWVWTLIADKASSKVRHIYEQSEGVFVQLVEMLTVRGELVVDPFLGSGTTGAACVQTGRRFIGGDIDAAAVRVARARLDIRKRA